jgi:hypothetical protein
MWSFPVLCARVKAEMQREKRMERISGGGKRKARKEVMPL